MMYKKQAFKETRLIVYIVLLINGLIFYNLKPFQYLCDDGAIKCSMCGMRKAIDKLLTFDLYGAYLSNHYIVLVVIFFLIAIIDVIFIFINNVLHS